jgi:UDP-N-acetylmuramoyl-tripeptide--D-alanyl-D-alanine ligase
VARALGLRGAADDVEFSTIGTDTRTLQPGALFVALEGERFDAHEFLEEALHRGAAGAVVRGGTPPVPGLTYFAVEDTLAALGLLARDRRREIAGPVVAVTGTNGKTSTKEMLKCVLATRWRVQATKENQNNLVGVPLTILAASDDCEALVVEAGSNLPGEIERLRDIIEPSVAIVTNVSTGHIEGFGSLEATLEEKVGLLRDVPVAVVGTRPPELAARARRMARRVIVAGLGPPAEVRPVAWRLREDARPELSFKEAQVTLPVLGAHQAENALIAIAAATELGIAEPVAARSLESVSLPPGRCQVLRKDDLIVVFDAYNANPASLAASLTTVDAIRAQRSLVVVLGSMLELGSESERLHREMADIVMARHPELVAALGAFVPAFHRHADALRDRLIVADDPDHLGRLLAPRLRGDELVLVKASRGVHLERAIPHLIPDDQRTCSTIS